jgi:hypothetical protein
MLTLRNPYPGAAAAGADVTNFSDWTVGTRPGASMSEGDFAVDTTHGRGYRWDATVGALLPIDVYGETFDLVARVNGDEANEAALTNFEELNSGSASTTYGGTSVTLDGVNTAQLKIPDALTSADVDNTNNIYWRIVCARGGSATSVNFGFRMRDSENELNIRVFDTNRFRRVRHNSSSSEIPTSLTDDAAFQTGDADTHVVEMYVKRDNNEDVCFVIVDGKVYHFSAFDQGSNSTATDSLTGMFAGPYSGGGDCDMIVYESTYCAF